MLAPYYYIFLGNSRNYMPPILVTSSAKRITSQIVAIVKSNGRKDFILRVLFSFVPARNYLFKVSNLSTRISHYSCSVLRMSVLTIFNINDANDVIIMSLLLTENIRQTCSNCWLRTGKRLLGLYWKGKPFWRQYWAYHALCIILSVNKIY